MPRKKNTNSKQKVSDPEALKKLAIEEVQKGNIEKSVQLLSEAIDLQNDNPVFYNNRSFAYFLLDDFQNSLQDAKKAIELKKDYGKAYVRCAQAYLELDKLEEGIEIIKEGKKYCPQEDLEEIEQTLHTEWKKQNVLPPESEELQVQNKMLQWLKDGGSDYSNLRIYFYEKNFRGVHAAKKIKKNQEILFVPLSHLITLDMARQDPICQIVIENKVELFSPKHSHFSIYLLREKNNPNSIWKPYLDILPSDYRTFPIFFTEEEFKYLKGSHFIEQVKERKSEMKRDYDNICEAVEEFKKYSFHEFCWARMTASSRNFGVEINGNKTDVLAPLADMLNHKRPKQTHWTFKNDKQGFVIEACQSFERGEQIYDSYGKKCNSRFLLNYGFTVDDNDGNEVYIRVEFDPNDPTLSQKQEYMKGNNSNNPNLFKGFRIQESYEEQANLDCLGYIRYTLLQDSQKIYELNQLHLQQQQNSRGKNTGYLPQKTGFISTKNEIQMWKLFKILLEIQQSKYENSIEHDQKVLNDPSNDINIINCTKLLLGEKIILRKQIDLAEKMLNLFQLSKKEIQQCQQKPEYIEYTNYINKVIIPNKL